MELLEFLIITVVVLYIIRMLVRIVMPMLFQKVMNNAQQQFNQNQQQQNNTRSTKAGKIKVDYIPEQKKGSVPDSEGDFIDYEEIK